MVAVVGFYHARPLMCLWMSLNSSYYLRVLKLTVKLGGFIERRYHNHAATYRTILVSPK